MCADTSKMPVKVINCTWADLTRPGARQKHWEAADRVVRYFDGQTYDGPRVFVMVDSSAEPNPHMVTLSKQRDDFKYFHLPEWRNVPEEYRENYPAAAARIPTDKYLQGKEFAQIFEGIRTGVDSHVQHPLELPRPALGSKRNFAVEVGIQLLSDQGHIANDGAIIYWDDDIYHPDYIQNAVTNLSARGIMFTAPVSYYVAHPTANKDRPHGFEVKIGHHIFGHPPEDYTWLQSDGSEVADPSKQILSPHPYGFTYAIRTKAWSEIGGVPNITRGEDRGLLFPIIQRYGVQAINLQRDLSEMVVRIAGDNNSFLAMSPGDMPVPESVQRSVDDLYNVWGPFLAPHFHGDQPPPRLVVDNTHRRDNMTGLWLPKAGLA